MSQTQVQLVGNVVSGAVFTGIVTANSSINVADVVGINSTGINVSGAITATSFSGDGSGLTGVGVGTDGSINTTGIITASSFSGDGSALTGVGVGTEDSINTTGIITASSFSGSGDGLIFRPEITSFSPTDGSTDVDLYTNIVLTFDQPIYAGVGSIFLRSSSGIGTEIVAIGIGSTTQITISNQTLTIDPITTDIEQVLPASTDVYVVLPEGVITNSIGLPNDLLDTYNFTTSPLALGDSFGGGYLICQSGGTMWVVAPSATEVSRTWYSRTDAVTTANANAACGNWFIPTTTLLQNPAYTCRTYWDSYSQVYYWSNCASHNPTQGGVVCFLDGSTGSPPYIGPPTAPSLWGGAFRNQSRLVRAFRCVTY